MIWDGATCSSAILDENETLNDIVMEILGKYYESIVEINSMLTLKKISVIREFFGAYAADIMVCDEYVRLSIKTRSTLRSIPEFLSECTEFLIYPDENGMNIDLYYYVNK